MINPREKALLTLYKIEYEGEYSNIAVKKALQGIVDKRDKSLVTQLVYGVIRRKITLDFIISKFSKVKIKKLSKFVLLVLRLGIYQIYFMDKIPESAAVDESVKLAKKYSPKSSGFVNAVLHSAIRERGSIKYPENRREFLSVKYSFPENIIDIFDKTDFCEELLSSLNKEPQTFVRVNSLKGAELEIDGVNIEKTILYDKARICSGFDVENSAEYKEGKFIVQDVAAMMASYALNPQKGDILIDVCAAPGGKTTHLAELMENEGRVIAFDIHPHKTEIIKKNAERMGIDIIEVKCRDSRKVDEGLVGTADKVLVDAPCSGLGIIRRKPDIKWNRDDLSELSEIQYKILASASKYLKVGGELVYSTCTLNPDENENIICRFIRDNPQFEFVNVELSPALARENDGWVTLYPNIDGTDGFFISKIKRCR